MSFPGHYGFEEDSSAGPSSQPLYPLSSSRRPWSPINYDDERAPQARSNTFSTHRQSHPVIGLNRVRRQEASEVSVEALDLADYARTLRQRPEAADDSPYPPFPFTSHVHPFSAPTPQRSSPTLNPPFVSYGEYPPSPPPIRPFSVSSRDTYMQPPSLVSGESSYETHESNASRSFPTHRPYSLPPFLAPVSAEHLPHRGPAIFSPSIGNNGLARYASPVFEDPEYGDISSFPAYTRHWFNSSLSKSKHSSLPAYPNVSYHPLSDHSRDALPWSPNDSQAGDPPLESSIKQERMKMLERDFGKKSTSEQEGVPLVGSVDENGNLITAGPKKRAAVRWAQGALALTAVISSVYGALVIKTKLPAPPAGKPQAYILYATSIIGFLLTFYLFAIRPCCCGRRKKPSDPGQRMPGGLIVLPVQGSRNGKKPKKKGKKGKGAQSAGGGDVQVNLIVDPQMFRGHELAASGDEDDSRTESRARRPGKGFFEGMAMEEAWKEARKFLKRMFAIDIVCCLVWGTVFVFVLFGNRCPPGQFNGWCDSYNIAIACACCLCLTFGLSVFFDISDLYASRASPRTRT